MPSHTTDPDLRSYLGIFRRRKWLIVAPVAVGLGASIAYGLTATREYTATAQLLVQSQTRPIGASGAQAVTPTDVATELQLLQSGPVYDAVRSRLHRVASVSASQVGQTDIISLSAVSRHPAQAAQTVNIYANEFVNYERAVAIRNLSNVETELQAQISATDTQLQSLPPGTPQAGALASQESVLKLQLAQLQVNGAIASGGIELVSPASVPTAPSSPKRTRTAIMGALGGLLAGLGLALLAERFDDVIYTKEDLLRVDPELLLMASIPLISTWTDSKKPYVVSLAEPTSEASEAYRSLRASLEFASESKIVKRAHTVLISSPVATEGKTSTVANLAIAIARAGRRVVVVSADLRRPRLERFFDVSDDQGLTSVVRGDSELDAVLTEFSEVAGLFVLPAGPIPSNPAELLSGTRIHQILDHLAERFDWVLIDSPPILPVADSLILARAASLHLLVVAAGQTSKNHAKDALYHLRTINANFIGVVLNGIERAEHYGYGYRYHPLSTPGGTLRTNLNGAMPTHRDIAHNLLPPD